MSKSFDTSVVEQALRHLGDVLGMHEARDLHATNAGIDRPLDKLDLGVGRQDLRLALQTVARADFDDRDFADLIRH